MIKSPYINIPIIIVSLTGSSATKGIFVWCIAPYLPLYIYIYTHPIQTASQSLVFLICDFVQLILIFLWHNVICLSPHFEATRFLSSKDGCKYLSYTLLFQSPCNLIKSIGSPNWNPKLAPPLRNECPENLLAGNQRSVKQAPSFTVKALFVKTDTSGQIWTEIRVWVRTQQDIQGTLLEWQMRGKTLM